MKKKVLFIVMAALIILPFAAVYAGELTVGNKVTTTTGVPSECGSLYQYGLKFDSGEINDGEEKSAFGNTITIDNFEYKDMNEPVKLDWEVTSGPGVLKVVVKTGDGDFPQTFTVFTKSGSVGRFEKEISHISFCWNDPPEIPTPTVETPTATVETPTATVETPTPTVETPTPTLETPTQTPTDDEKEDPTPTPTPTDDEKEDPTLTPTPTDEEKEDPTPTPTLTPTDEGKDDPTPTPTATLPIDKTPDAPSGGADLKYMSFFDTIIKWLCRIGFPFNQCRY